MHWRNIEEEIAIPRITAEMQGRLAAPLEALQQPPEAPVEARVLPEQHVRFPAHHDAIPAHCLGSGDPVRIFFVVVLLQDVRLAGQPFIREELQEEPIVPSDDEGDG